MGDLQSKAHASDEDRAASRNRGYDYDFRAVDSPRRYWYDYDFRAMDSTDRESQESYYSSSVESVSQSSGGTDETGECSLTGGYEYDFVKNPPEDMSCSICLHVLRDPVLTSCCGNHFCQSCIDRIRVEGNPCPLCQISKRKFEVMLDKFFQRKVKELKIKCPNSKHGCEWVGELGDVEKHIDTPSGCEYVEVLCGYFCGSRIQRRNLAKHKADYCPLRPFSCEYCRLVHDTYDFVTDVHWPVCEKYPVECPNECGIGTIEQRHIDDHLDEECPLTVVDCEFNIAGCSAQLPRKDMPRHTSENLAVHLSMVPKLFLELKTQLNEKDQEIAELKAVVDLQQEQITSLESSLQVTARLSKARSSASPGLTTPGFTEFVMEDFPRHMAAADRWFSESFYTHRRGYMMCLSVYANGSGKAKGSHISVYANIMAGEFDDDLDWPFQGSIDIKLLNIGLQKKDTFCFTSQSPMWSCGRVRKGKRHQVGQGNSAFLPHSVLSPVPEYLHFRVCSVQMY